MNTVQQRRSMNTKLSHQRRCNNKQPKSLENIVVKCKYRVLQKTIKSFVKKNTNQHIVDKYDNKSVEWNAFIARLTDTAVLLDKKYSKHNYFGYFDVVEKYISDIVILFLLTDQYDQHMATAHGDVIDAFDKVAALYHTREELDKHHNRLLCSINHFMAQVKYIKALENINAAQHELVQLERKIDELSQNIRSTVDQKTDIIVQCDNIICSLISSIYIDSHLSSQIPSDYYNNNNLGGFRRRN